MPEPVIVARVDHPISRRNIDPDALKVLYRLHDHRYAAYLVGGSVRDLLLGRRPKDFDIGTDAHPYQIKKIFRNCWIIGRRFRLAHVKFGPKTIEVATFRRIVPETAEAPGEPEASPEDVPVLVASSPEPDPAMSMLHRDNTFGTPEEDAFRRDFTINGLFYDIATYSVIDYVGGLGDLERRVVRSIGDPMVRFVEDPVRMLRAVVMAARLGFDLDPDVVTAIAELRGLIAKASPARLVEEYYKILRSGSAEATFRGLARARLLELITPELKAPPDALWESLARLDRYRGRFAEPPTELTNTVLVGALMVPLGELELDRRTAHGAKGHQVRSPFATMPVARRDLERLHQIRQLLPSLVDDNLPPRAVRSISNRPAFLDALSWMEIFEEAPEKVATWREHHAGSASDVREGEAPAADPRKRRRRRRRRRGGRGDGKPPAA